MTLNCTRVHSVYTNSCSKSSPKQDTHDGNTRETNSTIKKKNKKNKENLNTHEEIRERETVGGNEAQVNRLMRKREGEIEHNTPQTRESQNKTGDR